MSIVKTAAATALFMVVLAGQGHADCAEDIKGVFKNMISAGAYRVETSIKSNGTESKLTGVAKLPDSFDMNIPAGRLVMTKNGVWMQHGGKMEKMPAQMREAMQGMITQGMAIGEKNVKSAECLGSQEFEGASYTAYKYDGSGTFMGIESKSTVTLYTGADGLPAWMLVDGEAMGVKSMTTQKLTFDPSIEIKDPQ